MCRKLAVTDAAFGDLCECRLESLEQFCEDNNAEMVSKQMFGQTMARIGRGFTKKKFTDGFHYHVFGCDSKKLQQPFIIIDEDMEIEYIEEADTFIKEDD